ncbi:hypothetical protein C8R45DRAFT_1096660 [Mycena sanguinolenta]|nr:hypothetical protein C8R45DRAFT_1096660 [Mycena sanguinolenta]
MSPGVLDSECFGAPVPNYPFYIQAGSCYQPKHVSYWMYPTERAKCGNVGLTARTPAPERLPYRDEARSEPKTPPKPSGKGKGKGRAADKEDSEVSEDEDDEYRAEALFITALDADYCPLSNVIIISGLDSSIDAVMFRALANDTLYLIRTEPISILRVQELMWLRFEDVTAGQAAFGAMSSIAQDLTTSYRLDAKYSDATVYSCDVWNCPPLGSSNNAAPERAAPVDSEDTEMVQAVALSLEEPWRETSTTPVVTTSALNGNEVGMTPPSPVTSPPPSASPVDSEDMEMAQAVAQDGDEVRTTPPSPVTSPPSSASPSSREAPTGKGLPSTASGNKATQPLRMDALAVALHDSGVAPLSRFMGSSAGAEVEGWKGTNRSPPMAPGRDLLDRLSSLATQHQKGKRRRSPERTLNSGP